MGSIYRYVFQMKSDKFYYIKQTLLFFLSLGGDQIITPRQFLRNLEMKLRQDDEQ